jgi:hypothetical protein
MIGSLGDNPKVPKREPDQDMELHYYNTDIHRFFFIHCCCGYSIEIGPHFACQHSLKRNWDCEDVETFDCNFDIIKILNLNYNSRITERKFIYRIHTIITMQHIYDYAFYITESISHTKKVLAEMEQISTSIKLMI